MSPKVSLITVNFNGTDDTLACLKSLKKCTYPNFEVWVVDNGSDPDQFEKLQEGFWGGIKIQTTDVQADSRSLFADRCHFIRSDINLGFGGGNNLALRKIIEEGTSKYVYLLNNDTEVDPDCLTHTVARAEGKLSAESRPLFANSIGIVNSLCIQFDDRTKVENAGHELLDCGDSVYHSRGDSIEKYLEKIPPPSLHSGYPLSQRERKETPLYTNPQPLSPDLLGASGAAVLYRIDTLKECGLFDESFFLNYEDADLSLRCILYGWKTVLEPRSVVYHKVNASIKKVKNYDYFVRSQYNQFRAYFHNVPTLTLLLNLPFIIIHDLGVPILNLICMRWTIVRVFVHARLRFFRNIRSIWKVRRTNLAHQKTSGWYFLKLQKNFIPTYIRYFREIILEKRRSVFETKSSF